MVPMCCNICEGKLRRQLCSLEGESRASESNKLCQLSLSSWLNVVPAWKFHHAVSSFVRHLGSLSIILLWAQLHTVWSHQLSIMFFQPAVLTIISQFYQSSIGQLQELWELVRTSPHAQMLIMALIYCVVGCNSNRSWWGYMWSVEPESDCHRKRRSCKGAEKGEAGKEESSILGEKSAGGPDAGIQLQIAPTPAHSCELQNLIE